jgi:hypothetical protein
MSPTHLSSAAASLLDLLAGFGIVGSVLLAVGAFRRPTTATALVATIRESRSP